MNGGGSYDHYGGFGDFPAALPPYPYPYPCPPPKERVIVKYKEMTKHGLEQMIRQNQRSQLDIEAIISQYLYDRRWRRWGAYAASALFGGLVAVGVIVLAAEIVWKGL